MKKLSSNRPPVLTIAAIAIAMIALIATFGGIASGKKKHAKTHPPTITTTTVTATTNDPGQISGNGNFDVLSVTKQCDQGTAVSGGAFWGGTDVTGNEGTEQLMDIKRDGNGYTVRGATDLNGSNLTVQVTCQSIK
jgi:hypothetical protein